MKKLVHVHNTVFSPIYFLRHGLKIFLSGELLVSCSFQDCLWFLFNNLTMIGAGKTLFWVYLIWYSLNFLNMYLSDFNHVCRAFSLYFFKYYFVPFLPLFLPQLPLCTCCLMSQSCEALFFSNFFLSLP